MIWRLRRAGTVRDGSNECPKHVLNVKWMLCHSVNLASGEEGIILFFFSLYF